MSNTAWIRLTKGMFAEVDIGDIKELSQYKWYAKRNTTEGEGYGKYYAARGKWVNGSTVTIYMHREIMECPDSHEVDHKNDNSLCNKRHNLQVLTRAEHQLYRSQRS